MLFLDPTAETRQLLVPLRPGRNEDSGWGCGSVKRVDRTVRGARGVQGPPQEPAGGRGGGLSVGGRSRRGGWQAQVGRDRG